MLAASANECGPELAAVVQLLRGEKTPEWDAVVDALQAVVPPDGSAPGKPFEQARAVARAARLAHAAPPHPARAVFFRAVNNTYRCLAAAATGTFTENTAAQWLADLEPDYAAFFVASWLRRGLVDDSARPGLARYLRQLAASVFAPPPAVLPVLRAGGPPLSTASCAAVSWAGQYYDPALLYTPAPAVRGVSATAIARFDIPTGTPAPAVPGQTVTGDNWVCAKFMHTKHSAVVAPGITPAAAAQYNAACAGTVLAILASGAAQRLREAYPTFSGNRVGERVPLKTFVRVMMERLRPQLELWRSRLQTDPGLKRDLAFAQMSQELMGEPVPPALAGGAEGRPFIPVWAIAAASAAYHESAALWGALDRAKVRGAPAAAAAVARAGLDEAAARGAQVYQMAAQLAPLARAHWRARCIPAEYNSASDPAVYAAVKLQEFATDVENTLGERRADLLVFRESFALYVSKGL